MTTRLAILCLCLVSSSVGAIECADRDRAAVHYQNGVTQYRVGHFDQAVKEFQQSFELCPEPALLYNLAQTHRTAGDVEKALFFYKQYRSASPQLDPAKRKEVESRIAELEQAVAKSQSAPPVPEKPAQPAASPAPAPVTPPLAREQSAPAHWYKNLAGWALGGGGVALAIVGIGLAASAPGLNDNAVNAPTLPQAKEQRDQARTFNAAGWSLIGIGAAAAISGVIVFAVMRPKAERRAHLQVAPTLGGILVQGGW